MEYIINPSALSSVFMLPAAVDGHIKTATKTQLQVLIYIFRNMQGDIGISAVADALSLSTDEVSDAVGFWIDAGILSSAGKKDNTETKPKSQKTALIKSEKPTREEVARRGSEDEKIRFLLREAQLKFARPLKQSEASSLVWLYDDEGMDVSLILMLIEYAKSMDKCNIRFIESVASEWVNEGITDISEAEKRIEKKTRAELCWKLVCSAFGMPPRKPSKKEEELAVLWVDTWGYDRKIFEKAYNICVDTTSGFSIPYIKKIIEKWHSSGVKTAEDVTDEKKENGKEKKGTSGIKPAYDRNLVEQLLKGDD